MKKVLGIFLVIVSILVISVGCSNNENEYNALTHEQIIKVIEEIGISEIRIYKSKAHGTIGNKLVNKLTSSNDYISVLHAIKTAEEILSMLNTVTPDYDFVIKLKNNESFAFHFWLSPIHETSMFVYVNNTGLGYTVSKESTQTLLQYIR